jgi:hypothetical protein
LLGQVEQATFVSRHFAYLRQALEDRRKFISDERFEKEEATLDAARNTGELGVVSERGKAWIQTQAGVECLLSVIFDCSYQVVMEILLQHTEKMKRVIQRVLEESFPFARRTPPT